MIGGTSDKAMWRFASWGAGWTMGGGTAEAGAAAVAQVRSAWQGADREGEPRIAALIYYSLGHDAESDSRDYLRDYYGFLGDYAEGIAESALRSEAAMANAVAEYEQIGVTELFFDPTTTSLEQIDRLADVVL